MSSKRFKHYIQRILPFGIIWLLFAIIFLIIEQAAISGYDYSLEYVIDLDFSVTAFALIAVTFIGFTIGIIELLFINKLFSRQKFYIKILGKLFLYSAFLFLIICIMYPLAAGIELNTSISDPRIWDKFSDFLTSISFLSTTFQMAVSLFASLFYNEISEKIGTRAFLDFITGKYNAPKMEHRIFIFLDMRSSTTIAEKIGHTKYFELLRAYYSTMSKAIIEYSGSIYQYVGDEIVISWKFSSAKSDNCLHCFFDMKKDMLQKKDWFLDNFGAYPDFKAGIHFGEVTTGEIGKIKKDIVFTGDTLNTAARIQSLCNDLSTDILISKDLLPTLLLENYELSSAGKHQLKGKREAQELYTISVTK